MKPTLCLLLVMLTWTGGLVAGTTGKISGHVTDAGTDEPLPGANIVLVGTALGASTGSDGSYVILNIPPGTYDLRVALVGYGPALIKDVRIVADQTTPIDAKLAVAAVGMAEVVIQAVRPMVQKDATATIAVVNSEQIKMMPVKDFRGGAPDAVGRGCGRQKSLCTGRPVERSGLPDRRHVCQGSRPRDLRNEDS